MRHFVCILMALAATPADAQDVSPAAPIAQQYGAWSVTCPAQEAKQGCSFAQTIGDRQTGTPLAALELAAPSGDRAEGMLLTAFGLRLESGVQLAVDGQTLGASRRFLTCIASGCVVPVSFADVELAALKLGGALDVTATKVEDGRPVTFSLPLAGFSAAYDRSRGAAH